MINYASDPVMFDTDYRRYVSQLESSQKVVNKDFEKKAKLENPMYFNEPIDTFSSVVKNSHQEPRWSYNAIKPYVQKQIMGSYLHERFEKTPCYWGTQKFYPKNKPNLAEHWE